MSQWPNQALPLWSLHLDAEAAISITFNHPRVSEANRCAANLARLLAEPTLLGVQAVVPAMVSVTVFVDLSVWAQQIEPSLLDKAEFWAHQLAPLAEQACQLETEQPIGKRWRVPMCFEAEFAPDLPAVAEQIGQTPQRLIAQFLHLPIRVLMLGFAPGHPYLGFYPGLSGLGRRATPRTEVPAGSFGVANGQGVLYSVPSPGGWSLVGRTPWRLFDALRDEPVLFRAGDTLSFYPIDRDTFWRLHEQAGAMYER